MSPDDSKCVWSSWKSAEGRFDERELADARELARKATGKVCGAMQETVDRMGVYLSPTQASKQIVNPYALRERMLGRVADHEQGEDDDAKMDI
jgi:hypothetical protein